MMTIPYYDLFYHYQSSMSIGFTTKLVAVFMGTNKISCTAQARADYQNSRNNPPNFGSMGIAVIRVFHKRK
jgi:hypothetical protein